MNNDTTFILADNQDITRAGMFRFVSDMFPGCPIVEVACKKELVSVLAECGGGAVVILDYTLFDLTGVEELTVIGGRYPDSRWVVFSSELGEKLIRRMGVEHSISMILKENDGEEIRTALKCAFNKERFLCHQIANLLLTRPSEDKVRSILTASELDILRQIAHGKSVKEIAVQRNSSVHTIVTHKKNIFRKLEINNVYEATKYALRAGLIEMVEYYI